MDRSLLFFYGMMVLFLIFFTVKFIRSKDKGYTLTLILSVIVSCYTSSLFFPSDTGRWFILIIITTFFLFSILLFCHFMIKHFLATMHFSKVVGNIKNTPPEDLIKSLIDDHCRKQWYVIYSPSSNIIEIGINLTNSNPVLGEKFQIKSLSDRYLCFTPETFLDSINIESDLFCTLQDFYVFNKQTKKFVDDYIYRIKNDIETPWIIGNINSK